MGEKEVGSFVERGEAVRVVGRPVGEVGFGLESEAVVPES